MKEQNQTSIAGNLTDSPMIGQVMVQVPYNKPGNVVEHLPVEFVVFDNGSNLKAIPMCSKEEQRIVNLPPFIEFQIKAGRTIPNKRHYTYLAEDIIKTLSKRKL